MNTPNIIPLEAQARQHGPRTAIIASEGTFTYDELLTASGRVAAALLNGRADLEEGRVAFLVPPGFSYVATLWGIWRAGGIAVPLCVSHPAPELDYTIGDAGAECLVAHADFAPRLAPIAAARGIPLHDSEALRAAVASPLPTTAPLPAVTPERRALIIYTSGTTSRPKGVVTTHQTIAAQITCLVSAWEWSADDHILHVLPLHHVHGVINALSCALWSGACCELLPTFDADAVWERFAAGGLTLFMAVPTIYVRLIRAFDAAVATRQAQWGSACAALRLMVSGSAALPVSVLERWQEISGHTLLERYGMTEIGMALSNPLHGTRRAGFVGSPLPGVTVQLVDEAGQPPMPGQPGQIEVRGLSVFEEYWRRPDATRDTFRDGWFQTGDVAVFEEGAYRILGRESVDIIKTGGYKVSALEIEAVLLTHPAIAECAVIGLPDVEWGERVVAVVALHPDATLALDTLRPWAKERLATYKVPSRLHRVETLPRNALGKVTKPQLRTALRA